MDDLARLVARDAIRDLPLRYAVAVDGKDLDGVAALFVPDVDNGRFGPGRDGVRAFYDQSLRKFHCSMHLVANHLIDLAEGGNRSTVDRATGIVYCHARHHVTDPGPEHWFDEALAYFDDYERLDGEWLFRRRRLRSWFRQYAGHPTFGDARVEAPIETSGPKRGARMPEAFPSFEPFWSRPPLAPPTSPS